MTRRDAQGMGQLESSVVKARAVDEVVRNVTEVKSKESVK